MQRTSRSRSHHHPEKKLMWIRHPNFSHTCHHHVGLLPHVVDGGMGDHRVGVGINLLHTKKVKQGEEVPKKTTTFPNPLTFRASDPILSPKSDKVHKTPDVYILGPRHKEISISLCLPEDDESLVKHYRIAELPAPMQLHTIISIDQGFHKHPRRVVAHPTNSRIRTPVHFCSDFDLDTSY